ncbi:MAG: DNA polymerase I [Bacteroidales bacterium]
MNKIFLIDGHAQIFRMYYAFLRRPMVNSKGVDTSILFGFTKMIIDLINRELPTHLAVAFDPPAKTFRHSAFPQYKANRSATPQLVKEALEPLQEILAAFNIPVVMMPGYEADDVIGSMVKQWEGPNSQIYMVTPDKDYGQLISPHSFQYKPAKGGNEIEIIGEKQICEYYGIPTPEQVIDILTIWGDSSDNIPGIRGIGEVGAKKLIGKYGSLNAILANAAELPQKQQDTIKESLEQIEMSRFLVTIKTDLPLPLNIDDIKISQPAPSLGEVFNKYEFNSLKKLLPNSITFSTPQERTNQPLLPTPKETSITEFEISANKTKEVVIKFDNKDVLILGTENEYTVLQRPNIQLAKNILENSSIKKTGYNFKQYIKYLKSINIELNGEIADIELMHYLINPERSHKEDILIKSYLGIDTLNNKFLTFDAKEEQNLDIFSQQPDLFSAQNKEENTIEINEETINENGFIRKNEFIGEDEKKNLGIMCALLFKVEKKVAVELDKANQRELYNNIEAPLITVLANMEYEGVKIDTSHLKAYSLDLTKELNSIEQEIRNMVEDQTLNLSSPKQIGVILYEKLKLNPKIKKNAKGSYPTDEETLNELLSSHPIVSKILEHRGLKKLLSTYIDNFPLLISTQTGKIHTTFNQALTATGRLSSTNPNLQNIPIRSERGKEIRKAFIPSNPAGYIVSADYSQIELRLMAHLSGDIGLIEAFNQNKDIHTATAAKVFKIEETEVSKEQRSRAKVANFGIIYGISAFGLSQRLGMTRTDSKELIEEYFKNYPGVKEYMNNMIEKAKKEGYVESIYGRKRFLPDINSKNANVRSFSERNAINAPLQGSAADIIKVAMINVYNRLKAENIKSKMVLQVHDELVFDVLPNELNAIKIIVKEEMEKVIKLHVPLIADCGSGNNWLEAH